MKIFTRYFLKRRDQDFDRMIFHYYSEGEEDRLYLLLLLLR
jgi:hypothetical protein